MFWCRTLKQLNRKTIPIFKKNCNQYKTYLHPIPIKSQKRNYVPETENYGPNKREKDHSPRIKAEKRTTDFEELLMEAIDEGLSLLGESSKQLVYFYLEKNFKINRLDIPYRIDEFIDAIERIFGNGAKILKIQMMKCLFKQVGYAIKHYSDQRNLIFREYITAIKLEKENRENINEQHLTQTASRIEKRLHEY